MPQIRGASRREPDLDRRPDVEGEASSFSNSETTKSADLKTLACIAARLAGRDPDEHITVRIGDFIAFDDVAWRYPDFVKRAEAAYEVLSNSVEF